MGSETGIVAMYVSMYIERSLAIDFIAWFLVARENGIVE